MRALTTALAIVLTSATAHAESAGSPGGPPLETEWNSPALAVTGAATAGTGVLFVATGTAWWGFDIAAEAAEIEGQGEANIGVELGPAMMVTGAALILVGSVLFTAGSWQVLPDGEASLAFRVGAGRGDATLSF